jgi:hypothetical protein
MSIGKPEARQAGSKVSRKQGKPEARQAGSIEPVERKATDSLPDATQIQDKAGEKWISGKGHGVAEAEGSLAGLINVDQ